MFPQLCIFLQKIFEDHPRVVEAHSNQPLSHGGSLLYQRDSPMIFGGSPWRSPGSSVSQRAKKSHPTVLHDHPREMEAYLRAHWMLS